MSRPWIPSILFFLWSAGAAWAEPLTFRAEANVAVEISLTALRPCADPFNEMAVDAVFTDPRGAILRVPAFWAGGGSWKARYASHLTGTHRFRTECNRREDEGLHGVEGTVEVKSYGGENPLYRHGPIAVAADRRHFAHADGAPFFWLGDTWWMGLCHRLEWPEEFQKLATDRREKGFTVIQIVAGLYPDMPPFDERGANEAGFPWEKDYARIRPEYFDLADRRLARLVETGLVPCLVGAWGYFLPWMGVEKAKQHWRYLSARYGAWPVVWCVAGEANLPYYLVKGFPYDDREQVRGWTEVARHLRELDPFRRPLSIHPTGLGRLSARGAIEDPSLLDFDMLQTGHGRREVLRPTVDTLRASYAAAPAMPVVNSEVSYEMLLDQIPADIQRLMFWACMLSGAAGHTYGANGIWQLNRKGRPHGNSPHGGNYGSIPWDEAMNLPGSRQVGLGKKLLEELHWQRLDPLPEGAAWEGREKEAAWGDWIWFPEGNPARDAPAAARFFRRAFDLPAGAKVLRASLDIAADDKYKVWLNGREVGSGGSWKSPGRYNVAKELKPGRNLLAVRAENASAPVPQNPAGLNLALAVELEGGAAVTVATDGRWRASKAEAARWREEGFDDSGWEKAMVIARYGEGPWGKLGGEADFIVPFAAGIEDRLRILYVPDPRPIRVQKLEPAAAYRATSFDPASGERSKPFEFKASSAGAWIADPPGDGHDWVLILEKFQKG